MELSRGDRVHILNANGGLMKTDYGRIITVSVRGRVNGMVEVDAYPTRRLTGLYAPDSLVLAQPEEC